jgi:predicted extracellular nuclease
VLVTGRTVQGYYLQVVPSDAGYSGVDYSGIFVYDTANSVAPGDRVTISRAIVTDFYTQIELTSPIATIVSTGETLPEPVVVLPSEVTTGGSRAAALEAVTVRVANVTVTDVAPTLGGGDSAPSNEFVVASSLRVDDFMYLVVPFPAVGNVYTSITGILTYRTSNSKLEPRNAADLVK